MNFAISCNLKKNSIRTSLSKFQWKWFIQWSSKLKVKNHPEWTKLVTLGNNIKTNFNFSLMLFFTKDEDCDQNGCSLTHFWPMLPFYNLCNTRLCWNFQCSFYRSWVVLSQLTMISKFFQITNWKTVKLEKYWNHKGKSGLVG